nr:MAG TPA: hypothetical protein [Caudoviricetes sp.]
MKTTTTTLARNDGRGGARAGAGRKKKPWSGSVNLQIDLEVWEEIREAAQEDGERVGLFLTKAYAYYERFVRKRVPVPHFNLNEKRLPQALLTYFSFDFVSAEYMMLREMVAFEPAPDTYGYSEMKQTTIIFRGHKINIGYFRAYFIDGGKKVFREIPLSEDEAIYTAEFLEDMKSKTAG